MAGQVVRTSSFFSAARQAMLGFTVLTLLTGAGFPLLMFGLAHGLFPEQAHGSLLTGPNGVVGSRLIGQSFDAPEYFWGRPSATSPSPYNAASSSGSNLGPLHADLLKAARERLTALRADGGQHGSAVPLNLLTSSGSGLDPHISPAAAAYQIPRVARARGVAPEVLQRAIVEHTEQPTFGILGEARVNVLELNLSLSRGALPGS